VRTLYLVRHAEPVLTGRLLGRTDPPLSRRGVTQAENLHLPEAPIFTSTLRRATETARLAAHNKPFTALSAFDEISYGAWDGLTWDQIEQRYPDLALRKLENWLGVTPPGGEPWEHFRHRVVRGMEDLPPAASAVLIGHQAVHAIIAELLAGLDPMRFRQEYGEMRPLAW
jgi:broad specificity phosphatase PhoE